ncbi:MAG: porin [Desulfofustis sp.]|nr:porin [Desulfofustis sp.]
MSTGTTQGWFIAIDITVSAGGQVMTMKHYAAAALLAALTAGSTPAQAAGRTDVDADLLRELKRMIEQQQIQLDRQAAEIAALKEQLAGAGEALAGKADKAEMEGLDEAAYSSFDNVDVRFYGQFDPALLWADNGESSKTYVVDNVHSQTRFGLRASVAGIDRWNLGGRLEIGITGNSSNDVNQYYTYDATGDTFKLRWAEISFSDDRYGKLSLGKGDSASNNTAEIDLSGTSVAMQDKTLWMAGGTLWYQSAADRLSELRVKDIYNGFDGLSRTDRIRYDAPEIAGFSAAGSYSSGDAFDGSLWYTGEFAGTSLEAGIGIANPGDLMEDAELLYTGSASVLFPVGFSATFSGGLLEKSAAGMDDAAFWWAKLGYLKQFFDNAATAFSIDYGEAQNYTLNDDTGTTWALAAVHNVYPWHTEFYAIYRMYLADSDSADFDDVNAFMAGARLKF